MSRSAPEMLGPTLLAGAAAGVLAALPWVKLFNVGTCCSVVILGGVAASWLYSRECRRVDAGFTPAGGAVVGLIAGAFYAVATTVTSTAVIHLFGEPDVRFAVELLRDRASTPPELGDMLDGILMEMEHRVVRVSDTIVGFFSSILVGAVFSTVGGLIGGGLFAVPPPPPTVPDGGSG